MTTYRYANHSRIGFSSLAGSFPLPASDDLATQSRVCRQLARSNVAKDGLLIEPSPTSTLLDAKLHL
jgi:hypothetical protein